MQDNNPRNVKPKPKITMEYLEELDREFKSELSNKSKHQDNNFINNVIEEALHNDKKIKAELKKKIKSRKTTKDRSKVNLNTDNNIDYNIDYNIDNNIDYNLNTLEDVKKQREIVIDNVYKNILTNEFPKNVENKERALQKLSEYQYIHDITDLTRMRYIRYFTNDRDGNTYLASGGLFSKIINDKILLCQFSTKSFWSISVNSIIFKKMKDEEKLKFAIGEFIQKKEKSSTFDKL